MYVASCNNSIIINIYCLSRFLSASSGATIVFTEATSDVVPTTRDEFNKRRWKLLRINRMSVDISRGLLLVSVGPHNNKRRWKLPRINRMSVNISRGLLLVSLGPYFNWFTLGKKMVEYERSLRCNFGIVCICDLRYTRWWFRKFLRHYCLLRYIQRPRN